MSNNRKRLDESFTGDSLTKSFTGSTNVEVNISNLQVVNGNVQPSTNSNQNSSNTNNSSKK